MQQQREAVESLHFLADRLRLQLDNPDPRFMDNALRRIQPALQLANEIRDTENRRTMPITNSTGTSGSKRRRNVLPTSMIGYRFPEGNNDS